MKKDKKAVEESEAKTPGQKEDQDPKCIWEEVILEEEIVIE